MLKRITYYYQRLPNYLSYRAPTWIFELLAPWLYKHCVPRLQDAPVIVFTMGKVGTTTFLSSLRDTEVLFVKFTHNLHRKYRPNPYRPFRKVIHSKIQTVTRLMFIPWLKRRPRLRIITAVREPIGRLISLYLFSYTIRFGEKREDVSLQKLLDDFPKLFEQDYSLPLVPGHFMTNELQRFLGTNVYQHPSPRVEGSSVIEQGRSTLLILKLEISDEQKFAALSSWMGRPIKMTLKNTAKDAGYSDIYDEFKKRVRIPYRYAEAIYRSSYMKHFYTPEERAKFWQRWEPQLDKSIPLPDWVENQLQKYHPPVAELPQ